MSYKKILVINPNPDYTKLAVYRHTSIIFLKTIRHKQSELEKFKDFTEQTNFRAGRIMKELKGSEVDISLIEMVMGRGGLIKPVKSGVYAVNEKMKKDLIKGVMGQHENNMGGLIADKIARQLPNAKAYIADPVVVDEMEDIAKVTGHPLFKRKSIFHALTQKHIGRRYAKAIMRNYNDLNLIITHIESGISVGAHKKGRVIDVNQALDGGGPFSFHRTGTLPVGDLVDLCFSGKYTKQDVEDMISKEGGFMAYLGTKTPADVEEKVDAGDKNAKFIVKALAYQIAKEVGAMYAVLGGEVNGIILSGELFQWKYFTDEVSKKIEKIAPIAVFPEEEIIDAMAMNAVSVLKGERDVFEY